MDSGGTVRDAAFGREANARQWADGLEFKLNVPWDGLPHEDQVSICTVQPFVKFLGNPEIADSFWYLSPFFRDWRRITSFMCDSAAWITSYTGGCVVGSIAPVFILNGNDAKVRESALHWWAALYHPNLTRPQKAGGKRIPGAWNQHNPGCSSTSSGPGGCLHRTRDAAKVTANRDVAIPQCHQIKPGYTKPDSCDEFPFASTMEGASSTTNDYSVKIIPVKDNCSSGARTSVFYQRNRIRNLSPFWVDVILPNASEPVSGSPGNVVTEPFPEEIEDMDRCPSDGTS